MKLTWNTWKSNIAKKQLILGAFFLCPIFIAIVQLIFVDNFIVAPRVSLFALYAACIISLLICMAVVILKSTTKRRFETVSKPISGSQKLLSILFIPLLLVSVYWVIVAVFIPYQITRVTGQPFELKTLVHKESHRRRRAIISGRRFELRLVDSQPMSIFRYKISEQTYNRIPEGNLEARLVGVKGRLGFIVENIEIESHPSH